MFTIIKLGLNASSKQEREECYNEKKSNLKIYFHNKKISTTRVFFLSIDIIDTYTRQSLATSSTHHISFQILP